MMEQLRCFGTVAFLAVSASACSFSADAASDDPASCPIYETRDWNAFIEPVDTGEAPYVLQVAGTVDLPNPSYEVAFRPGPMDRRRPPALTIFLDAKAGDGAALQVIDQRMVEYRFETPISNFRAVRIVCGDRLLAEISDASLAE